MTIIGTFTTLTGLNADDLIVHTEADELIRPDLLTFLKLYDGYPVEPLAFKVKPRKGRHWHSLNWIVCTQTQTFRFAVPLVGVRFLVTQT